MNDSTGMRHESISTYNHDSPGQSGFELSVIERSSSAGFPAAARSMDKSSLYTPVGLPKWGLFSNDDVCELRGQIFLAGVDG